MTEILFVVGILGLIVSIAVPSYLRARNKAQTTTCIENLRHIEGALQQYAFESGEGATIKKKDLLKFLKAGAFPECPAGGDYTVNTSKELPKCSLKKQGHTL